jgi:hypothetical protein
MNHRILHHVVLIPSPLSKSNCQSEEDCLSLPASSGNGQSEVSDASSSSESAAGWSRFFSDKSIADILTPLCVCVCVCLCCNYIFFMTR